MLRLESVTKRYRGTAALDGVSMAVSAGAVHGLLGPNGAGKTTLLRIVLGLTRPDSGSVLIRSRPVTGRGARAELAGVPDGAPAWPYLTGRDNLSLLGRLDGLSGADLDIRIDEVLNRLRLGAVAGRRVGGWSLGMRSRLALAAALLRRPRLLLLDEPTNGLDAAGRQDLRQLLADLAHDGVAVLLCSHDMSEVEAACSDVTILRRGQVAFTGELEALRRQAPDPVHLLVTGDQEATGQLADAFPGLVAKETGAEGFQVSAQQGDLDRFVLELGRRGVPVRSLSLRRGALEGAFMAMTAGEQA